MTHGSNQGVRNYKRQLARKKLNEEKVRQKAESKAVNCILCNQPIAEPFTNMTTVEFCGKPVPVHRECPGEEKV